MDRVKTLKILGIIGLIAALLAPIIIGWALTYFSKNFDWGFPNKSFQVYSDVAYTQIWTPGAENITSTITQAGTYSFTFYVKNIGNMPLTISVVEDAYQNCTAAWTPTSLSLTPNQSGSFLLELTVTDTGTPPQGSYDFHFTA